jgi:flagellar protein FlgJ
MDIAPLPKAVSASDIPPEQLAHNSALTEQQKIVEASRQFEAILLRQILGTTQKTIIPSKFANNSLSSEIYRDMITTQLADSISKSKSFGLAKTFEHQLAPRAASGAPKSPPAASAKIQPGRTSFSSATPSTPTPLGGNPTL